jgi:GNAT superfamily N-acetyltransferase
MYASLGSDLVTARRDRLMAEAQTSRVAKQARLLRAATPADAEHTARGVCLRVLEPADIGQIRGLFERLSLRSRQLRFLAPVRTLSEQWLRTLASIDHVNHEALGAFDDGLLIGSAHYVREPADPLRAEISVEVADSHQRRGIGPRLLNDLALLARSRGIAQFYATALRENAGVVAMLRSSAWPSEVSQAGSELEIALTLPHGALLLAC